MSWISKHTTLVGKVWLTLLIIFRILLTAIGGKYIFYDEPSTFSCRTPQRVVENIQCYDAFRPIGLPCFWVFQVIMITTPTIMYLGFAMHKLARMDDAEYRPRIFSVSRGTYRDYKPSKKHGGLQRIKRDGLMKVYVFQLLSRATFEVAFLFGQYVLYGLEVAPSYVCNLQSPFPHTVDCYVSRPTEKTIFLLVMYGVSALCLFFTFLEILHLVCFCSAVDQNKLNFTQENQSMLRMRSVTV